MTVERYRINIEGLVQGVGFRPFVYRLAQQKLLSGWVANNSQGVQIEVQGEVLLIGDFLHELTTKKPPQAKIHAIQTSSIALAQTSGFAIKESFQGEQPSSVVSGVVPTAMVPPDMAPCEECQQEMFDPSNLRYRYPFNNCTRCGPRFSIIESLPYDRTNTTMKQFPLCDNCQKEYKNPIDRRFHAEPIACPDCGPQLQLCGANGEIIIDKNEALEQAATALIEGLIVAVKAVGGFQLLVDATNPEAVNRLRKRKQRPAKPFALMYPDIETVQQHCRVSAQEQELLISPQRPIVLLVRKDLASSDIAATIAPGNPNLGIMLPASPLHYLLMSTLQRPIVATSGNLAGEPICITNKEALARLGPVADLMLVHDRAIVRPVDDSIVRVMNGMTTMLRRSRGYAPLPLLLPQLLPLPAPVNTSSQLPDLLAAGGHLKNTVAISRGNQVYLSQHLGDLTNRQSQHAFERAISDLSTLYSIDPEIIVHDQHPTYASTAWAQSKGKKCIAVQHHIAHFFSCMAEHQHTGPALGVSWDGSGYGADGIIHGGEFLFWDGHQQINHLATLRPFPLPGGEQAIREPRRQAAGLLYTLLGDNAFTQAPELWQQFSSSEQHNLSRMLSRQLHSPLCSSIGRLFDAAAALLGIATHNDFEGQAAMALEACAHSSNASWHFPFELLTQEITQENRKQAQWIIDWGPTVKALIDSQQMTIPLADRAAAFHNTLAEMILAISKRLGDYPVFLSGGVFQNQRLTETAAQLLHQNDRKVYTHETVPPNDGGIALGQIYYARCMENITCV